MQDDLLLTLQLFLFESGFGENVSQDIDGERHVVFQDARVVGGRFGRGGGVYFATDILDLFGDLAGAAARGSLEGHVFEQVGNPVLVCRLVART